MREVVSTWHDVAEAGWQFFELMCVCANVGLAFYIAAE